MLNDSLETRNKIIKIIEKVGIEVFENAANEAKNGVGTNLIGIKEVIIKKRGEHINIYKEKNKQKKNGINVTVSSTYLKEIIEYHKKKIRNSCIRFKKDPTPGEILRKKLKRKKHLIFKKFRATITI